MRKSFMLHKCTSPYAGCKTVTPYTNVASFWIQDAERSYTYFNNSILELAENLRMNCCTDVSISVKRITPFLQSLDYNSS